MRRPTSGPFAAAGGEAPVSTSVVLVSCDRAICAAADRRHDLRDADARLERFLQPRVPRSEAVDELYAAIVDGRRALHDGRWAMATLEVCLAVLQSARERRDIALSHQVGVAP